MSCAFVGWRHGEHLFHHRPLDQDDRRICRSAAGIRSQSRCRREIHPAIAHQPAIQSARPPGSAGTLADRLEHIAELGGLRGNPRGAEPSRNAYWSVRSFRNYADYALTAPFAAGMARLRERGSGHRCAIMWHRRSDAGAGGMRKHHRKPLRRSQSRGYRHVQRNFIWPQREPELWKQHHGRFDFKSWIYPVFLAVLGAARRHCHSASLSRAR